MMDATTAAWVLKNERADEGNHAVAVATLREVSEFVRIVHGAPEGGEWPILSVEPAEPPQKPLMLYRRAAPEYASGLFWTTSRFAAWAHTADRVGLQMYEAVIEPDDIVAEFVMKNRNGHTSGGEYLALVR